MKTLLLLFFTCIYYCSHGQKCLSHENLGVEMSFNEDRRENLNTINKSIQKWSESKNRSSAVITIPVVFNIIKTVQDPFVSNAQILSQLDVLNEDFRRLNSDANDDWIQAADCEIEFCLASRDIDGHAISGIRRKNVSTTGFSGNAGALTYNDLKTETFGIGIAKTPSTDYLNIWVTDIFNSCTGSDILGYAQFPGGDSETDGIVIHYIAFGTIGTAIAPYDLGRTATHEVGHWLNLYHPWGFAEDQDEDPCDIEYDVDFCDVDDLVDDTPNTEEVHFSCNQGPFFSCNTSDMVANYMDYSDDACMNLFTQGQKTRMVAILDLERNSLLQSEGCTAPITCNAVAEMEYISISSTEGTMTWNAVIGATSYEYKYREVGGNTWIILETEENMISLNNLSAFTKYEFSVKPDCNENYGTLIFETACDDSLVCDLCAPIIDVDIQQSQILGIGQVSGNLTVNSGAILTINSKVEFRESSRVLIKSGGKLIIENGGLLTNCPDGDKWQGVHLESPLAFYLNFIDPGIIEMKSGGTIENAVTGIDTRNSYSPLYPSGYTYEHGGGIVNMDSGAKIDNCETGINFARFGWGSTSNPSLYMDEQSIINNSFISNCDVGIYMDNNIGLEVNGTVFTDNYPDVESHISSFDFTGNTFHYGIEMFAEYPNFQGANIISNNFIGTYDVGSVLFMESQGNAEPVIFDKNSTFGFGMRIFGDAQFFARNNDFYDGQGIEASESGDNQFNMVEDNAFFGNEYGSSVNGVNDIEYLTNCFESTQKHDIEVNNSASIHEAQGDPFGQLSAGNCFDKRITTGINVDTFDYWTKDGYTFFPNECKYPGDGSFRKQLAGTELDNDDCGTFGNYTGTLPRSYRDCRCGPDPAGCIDMVNALLDEIDRLENDNTINYWVKRWLIAKYRRCINSVQKSFVKILLDDGRTEDAINHLSVLPSFRLRIMAYALMMNAHEVDRARAYINSLNTDGEGEQAFVQSQNIYLDYLNNRSSFELSNADRNYLLSVARDKNPYSGYTRSIYYKLTGERINIEFEHLDGSKSNTRAISKKMDSRLNVFPNPVIDNYFHVSIDEFSHDSKYLIKILSLDGKVIESTNISENIIRININENQGVFIVQLFENNELVSTQKLVKI
jgi:hypothetical protein